MVTCFFSNIPLIRQTLSVAYAVDSNLDCQSLEEIQPLHQGKAILCLSLLTGSLKNSFICQDRMPTFELTSSLYFYLKVVYNPGVNNLVPGEGNYWLLHFAVQGWLLWWYYYTEFLQSSFSLMFVCCSCFAILNLWHHQGFYPTQLSCWKQRPGTYIWIVCGSLDDFSCCRKSLCIQQANVLMRNWNKINILEGIWECSSCCLSADSFSLIPLLKPALSSSSYDII